MRVNGVIVHLSLAILNEQKMRRYRVDMNALKHHLKHLMPSRRLHVSNPLSYLNNWIYVSNMVNIIITLFQLKRLLAWLLQSYKTVRQFLMKI
jgi:hypothetical protein